MKKTIMLVKIILSVNLLILMLNASSNKLNSVQYDNETELYIIGTVHESTDNFNSDTLLNILNKISPDVILIESDSTYFTPAFNLNDDIKEAFLETKAVTEYLKTKQAVLRPYDISGRDNFLDNIKRKSSESDFFNDITSLYANGSYNKEAADLYNKILSMIRTAEEMSYSNASFINSPEGSSKIDTINYYTYQGLTRLIRYTSELNNYRSYWEDECSYWEKRNNVMLENILNITDFYEGKRIVVLCGFAHRNILKKGILNSNIKNLILKEFWNN